jgi:hypothetical protein
MRLIPGLRRQMQEDHKVKANTSLCYIGRTLSQQNKRTGGMVQAIQHLLCKHEALSSNPRPTKQKTKQKD